MHTPALLPAAARARLHLSTRCTLVVLICLATLASLPARLTYAATITVNTTADELNSDGDCSLREAIQAANTDAAVDACQAGSGADMISLPAGSYTLALAGSGEDANATGDLDITGSLTISGAATATTIIDANGIDRVFQIFTGANTQMENVTIRGGNATGGDGGGIYFDAPLSLNYVTLRNNTANVGGGLYSTAAGVLAVTNSTLRNNTAPFCCGGAGELNGPVTIMNSTISGNSAAANGGAFRFAGATTVIAYSTFFGNTANTFAGVWRVNAGTVTVSNTIIHASGSNPCSVTTSGGYNITNLSGANTCSSTLTAPTDLTGTDPRLVPLQDNGGATETHTLLPASPAIDRIPTGMNGCGTTPTTDQRGLSRPHLSGCDVGAVESRGFSLVVSSGDGQSAATNSAFTNPLAVRLTETGYAGLPGASISFTGPASGAGISPATVNAITNAAGIASASVTANDTAGSYTVQASAQSVTDTVSFNLSNTAPGGSAFSSNPAPGSTINIGTAPVGAMISGTLTFTETGTTTLNITSHSLGGANPGDFVVTPASLSIPDGGAPQSLTITCTPSALGMRSATLTVNHNGAGSPATYNLSCSATNILYLPFVAQ